MKKIIDFPDEIIDKVNLYRKENCLTSFCQALFCMIEEREKEKKLEEKITEQLEDKFEKTMTRIRLGVSTTDKNVQILLECMNALAWKEDLKPMPTIVNETELLKDSRKVVKDRITHFKQKKDWKNK